MSKLLNKFKKKDEESNSNSPTISKNAKFRNIVVLDGDPGHDWVALFQDESKNPQALEDGSYIRVVQASWIETQVTVYEDIGCLMIIAPIRESEGLVVRPQTLTVKPDLLIIRNQCRGPSPDSDMRNVLYGLMMANIPSLNSLQSEYMQLERPIMYGALDEIRKRIGKEKFPLIPQTYYSSSSQMVISPDFPCVLKISHAHRGMGKVKLSNGDEFRDLATVVALHRDYSTIERFIDCEYGLRVQKVGENYRVYKKVFTGSGWKSQFGGSDLQEIPINDTYKLWVDECSKSFGGMDWLAIDALHGKDGKDYIIELNGSAIGFLPKNWMQDTLHVKELVLKKLNSLFPKS